MKPRNYYDVLGVTLSATSAEIQSAYRLLAKMFHPDRFDPTLQSREWKKAHEMLLELNQAYSVLKDPSSRQRYDAMLNAPEQKQYDSHRDAARHAETSENRQSAGDRKGQTDEPKDTKHQQPPVAPKTYWSHPIEDLPESVQSRLQEIQTGQNADAVAWTRSHGWLPIVFMLMSAAWLIGLFFLADTWRWTSEIQSFYGLLSAGSGVTFILSIRYWQQWRRAKIKPFVCFRPLYIIRTDLKRVEWWLLSSMKLCKPTNHSINGIPTGTYLTIEFSDCLTQISVPFVSKKSVEQLRTKFGEWHQRLTVAQQQQDTNTFVQLDDFREFWTVSGSSTTRAGNSGKEQWTKTVLECCAAVVIGILVFAVANYSNDYNDDQKRWEEALNINRASSYRKYLTDRPDGRHIEPAKQKIVEMYSEAEKAYSSALSAGFDPDASSAVRNLLIWAKRGGDWNVQIIFDRNNDIPPKIEQTLARRHNVKNIISMGDSFSEQRLRQREGQIVKVVNDAFSRIIPQDILRFSTDSGGGNRPKIFINYTITAGDSLYYRDSDKSISELQRPYFPGISIDWEFEIRDPRNNPLYRFSIESKPAEHIQYRATESGASEERPIIYDAMASSAFSDLQSVMVSKLGVAEHSQTDSTTKPRRETPHGGKAAIAMPPIDLDKLARQMGGTVRTNPKEDDLDKLEPPASQKKPAYDYSALATKPPTKQIPPTLLESRKAASADINESVTWADVQKAFSAGDYEGSARLWNRLPRQVKEQVRKNEEADPAFYSEWRKKLVKAINAYYARQMGPNVQVKLDETDSRTILFIGFSPDSARRFMAKEENTAYFESTGFDRSIFRGDRGETYIDCRLVDWGKWSCH